MLFSLPLLCVSLAAASTLHGAHQFQKRDDAVCTDLSVSSNNGDRKVAIVMDSSGSMASNDPYDLRIKAGRALNEFLIASSEASGSHKADQVTVIDFDDEAYLDFPLGDPGSANSSFDAVDATGGTYIASGVSMAIEQLTRSGGATDKRSAIVVFTDGQDSNPDELVDAINNATAAGIRVSFGFLDTSASSQPSDVLSAVKNSSGVYATITVAAGSQNFINYVLLNGLTYNDNPQGYDSQLLAGLAETHFITGSDTVTLKYSAQQGERVNFTITSISAGTLDIVAAMGGSELNRTNTTYGYEIIDVTAPSTGQMDLRVTAKRAPKDAMFSVITNSNVPFKNCTVGVTGGGGGGGLSAGGKAGVGIGVTAALLGLGGLGYYMYKHFMGPGSGSNAVPPSGGESNNFAPTGSEKTMAHTDVYPVDPGSHPVPPNLHGAPPGSHGLPPNGYEAPMSGGPPGPQGVAPPGQPGFAPPAHGGMPPPGPVAPPANAPVAPPGAPMGSPPPPMSSVPSTGAPAFPGSQPIASVPPMAPPNALNPSNTAPKDPNAKGPSGPQSQAGPQPQQTKYYDMGNLPPGNHQPMGANSSQPMSPSSPASQNMTGGPGGPGAHPPAPGSQAAPYGYSLDGQTFSSPGSPSPMGPGANPPASGSQVPFGHGGEGHTISPGSPAPPGSHPSLPGSQMPFGHGAESVPGSQAPGSGSYPPAPSSQATPAPGSQYAPGAETFQHNSTPNPYHGNPGQMPGGPENNYQSFSKQDSFHQPTTGADTYTYTYTMDGPGGQNIAPPNPMGSDPNFNHSMPQYGPGGQAPMTGPDGYNHTHTMPGQQGTMSPDSYHQHSHPGGPQGPASPDAYHQSQHGGPSPQGNSSPYTSQPNPSSTAPTSTYHTTSPDMYHQSGHGGGDNLSSPPGAPDPHNPNPSSEAPTPSGGDLNNSDWTDYHDPDSCSCSEGPGPDSDFESADPEPGADSTVNQGFFVPGAPSRGPDKSKKPKHKHTRRRFPRLARGRVGKHHHHPWLGRDVECTDEECVFNAPGHKCEREGGEQCGCKCRDEECEVYKRKLRERRHRDGGLSVVANVIG